MTKQDFITNELNIVKDQIALIFLAVFVIGVISFTYYPNLNRLVASSEQTGVSIVETFNVVVVAIIIVSSLFLIYNTVKLVLHVNRIQSLSKGLKKGE